MAANKVKFNIKNVHYAKKTDSGYATPVALKGAVSISLEAQGELSPFYADGIKYYVASSNTGYEGDLEVAMITDEFRKDILGEELDSNGVLVEKSTKATTQFALGFDIDGDQGTTHYWFYNCTATRPSTASSTTEASKTPTTDTITISCAGETDGVIRSKSTDTTGSSTASGWFTSVYVPTAEE